MAEEVDYTDLTLEKPSIGSGAFADVYKATWRTKNGKENIVVKKFRDINKDEVIDKEVEYLLRVNHDNIVKLHGITKDNELRTLILMECADGGCLYNFLHGEGQKDRKYTYLAALNWMLQCAKGVAYLHQMERKILHRDLKTSNLLLFNNYRKLKICDFGTVTELVSKTMTTIGTANYMAPEVARKEKYTEKCDVYSFGIILWEVMSRKKPFYNLPNNAVIVLYNASRGERPELDDVKFSNSDHIKKLIQECWDQNPISRPTMKRLAFILGTNPLSTEPDSYVKLSPLPETSDKDINIEKHDNVPT